MSKTLKEAMKQSIYTLLEGGNHSHRKIAKLLGINRKTVDKYARRYFENGPIPPTGTDLQNGPVPPIGFSGRKSSCLPYHDIIVKWLESGLTAKRIHQDLVSDYAFSGSYDSVKRYVRKLSESSPVPFRRMEVRPGLEAQVDFGQGAYVTVNGKKKRPNLFCVTLSNSRAGYDEVVWRQTTDEFIRALENAFRHFGGVPETIVIDNLRAAVRNPDWFDPELVRKLLEFAEHYNIVILPTRPRTPEHKGKVESRVKYVQDNALKGRVFSSLGEQNEFLRNWNQNVASTRIHGTTKRQVREAFEAEQPHLQALPPTLFPCFSEGKRKVHRDGYVELERSYYSVPCEYCRREVWVRWDGRTVRIFNLRHEQIAVHAKVDPGRFSTHEGHLSEKKISALEKGPEWIVSQARKIGSHAEAWVRALLKNRKQYGLRPSIGLLSLRRKYRIREIDAACEKALKAEAFRLKDVKNMIKTKVEQPEFSFMEEHPLIRNVAEYGEFAVWHD